MKLKQKLKVYFHKFFTDLRASKRNYRKYSIDELFAIQPTGRSTDPNTPYARQTAQELQWLINEHLLQIKPKSLLEIGTASGGTSLILATIFDESQVYGIDLTDALHSKKLRNMKNHHMIIGNSCEKGTIKKLNNKCKKFDFILIDGDHSEIGVMSDMETFLPMLNKNGLLVFHDVRHNPPGGIRPIYYNKIKPLLKDSFEYFVNENNNGYGLWYKN